MPPKRGFAPEDMWSLRSVSDPQVSPDGAHVAFVVGSPDTEIDKQATSIWVAPVDGSFARILACGMAAPVESVTLPTRVP